MQSLATSQYTKLPKLTTVNFATKSEQLPVTIKSDDEESRPKSTVASFRMEKYAS